METAPDWSAWSRGAIRLMRERNRTWMNRYGLKGCSFAWNLPCAELVFQCENDEVACDICVIGTLSKSEGTFLWAWANTAIPVRPQRGLTRVREFGELWGLGLLIEPEWSGGQAEGLEMVAIAGRILDAEGTFTDEVGDVTLFFALSNFQRRQK